MNNQPSLFDMAKEVETINRANGWYEENRTFGDSIALLHSEVSEALEGFRNKDMINVAEEMADVFIRLLDTCSRYNIDLYSEFVKKNNKNRNRGYRHGNKVL